jgi:hypothetical protein
VLNEKYYLGGSFLEAGLGTRPSYVWRSVWNAKSLLREGLMWRVGDGSSIKIWKDRWVPVPSTYSIQSPTKILSQDATVSQFIDADLKWWNFPLIKEVLTEEEAAVVCSIPICPGRQQDKKVWISTRNGLFSVNSAYHLAIDIVEAKRGSCSDSTLQTKQWKDIWKIKGPMVVKTFLWKAYNEILPTRVNLHKRGIVYDPLCPVCRVEDETVGHILWRCSAAVGVWSICSNVINKCPSIDGSFGQVIRVLGERLDGDGLQLAAVVAQLLWLRRNNWVFGGELQSPHDLLMHAVDQVQQFVRAEDSKRAPRPPQHTQSVQRWEKPPFGVVKFNWDAAVDKERGKMGIGVIVRDHNGDILAALVATRQYIV